ncbi:Mth938-like domain-containing protein [uncultured Sphingomonas sp.]|uniref:Mth938-like domain-containing protein n=1 Tax=uncultured Sphingomonas sp. TaxID=158754 RepID=UPI0035CC0E73
MRIDRAGDAEGPLVSSIGPRGFRVDDGYYPALLLTPTRADLWSPPSIETLDIDELAALVAARPEFILIGTGANLVRPPVALIRALEAREIGVEAMDSRAAARAWGVLRAERRSIAAALYPLAQ